jgi:hypothetical protein
VEMALAMVAVVGAGLMVKSWANSIGADKFMRPATLLTMRISLPESLSKKTTGQGDVSADGEPIRALPEFSPPPQSPQSSQRVQFVASSPSKASPRLPRRAALRSNQPISPTISEPWDCLSERAANYGAGWPRRRASPSSARPCSGFPGEEPIGKRTAGDYNSKSPG